MAENDHKTPPQSLTACVKEKQNKISALSQKLGRLLNGYLDQVIGQETYRVEKRKLLSQEKSLEEEIYNLSHKQNNWLEPMKEWVKDAQNLNGIVRDTDLFAKKVKAKEIFGLDLLLDEKTVRIAEGNAPNSLGKTGEISWTRFARLTTWLRKSRFVLYGCLYRTKLELISKIYKMDEFLLNIFSGKKIRKNSADVF